MSILQISGLQNLDLLLVGITIAAIGILGFIVFLNNRKSSTNRAFLFFSIITIAYGISNYFSYQIAQPDLVLWFIRITLFFAVWHAFSFFTLFYVFPKDNIKFSKFYKIGLIPLAIFTSFFTLTPFVFSGVEFSSFDQIPFPRIAPGIGLFGFVILFLVVGGASFLIKKTVRARDLEKTQYRIVSIGTFITFACIITFNFIFPVVFTEVVLIPLAPIFFLPFILFTAYAILRYGLLDIKVIATEILTFVLAVVTLFEILFAQDLKVLVFRISLFAGVLGFGILLIRSVRKEVEQREKLQELTHKLEVANEELKRLDKAKSEFVSIASHQLRTPLTATKGYISLVLEGTYGAIEEKFKKPLRNVYYSNERLIHLVNDLLSLSRIESGRMTLERELVDIEEVVKGVIDELQIKAEERGLKLILEKSSSAPLEARLDKEKIRNVILNLIDNAIRYAKEGSITTSIAQDGDKLHLAVQDTGEGMTKEEIGKLFESFSRGQAGEKLSREGAGLGLYIARQFVQMHKGNIWATSEGKGKGSTFHIELPIQ